VQPLAIRQTVSGSISPLPPRSSVTLDDTRDAHARFKSLVLPHLDDAHGLARWITGSRTDADDVVQEACMRAFRGIANFSNGNPRAWVLTIVRHTAYAWLRKNRPASLDLVEDLDGIARAQSSEWETQSPETALIAKDDATLLRAAIGALPAPFRETLVLRDLRGLNYREIAEVTDAPTGTVMSRLARARGALIGIMAGWAQPCGRTTPVRQKKSDGEMT
jgi:RNA polymerase sigma-70 factor (ECF subfamily)